MKIFGQIESASLEQLSSDPAGNTQGRIFQNTTDGRTKLDDGVNKRALFRNDQKFIVGNDVTPANNVRVHKGPSGVLQDVIGSDVTAEGVSSTAIAQRTSRAENLTSVTLPSAGNAGRSSWLTDQKVLAVDDGFIFWRKVIPEHLVTDTTAGATITLGAIVSSVVRLTGSFSAIEMIPAGFSAQRAVLINRTGVDVMISNDSGATAVDRILTGTGANLVFKSNSALPIQYDSVTARWQVVSGTSAAGGGDLPNSTVIVVTGVEAGTSYSTLATDDVILCNVSAGPVIVTPISAAGNLGKRILFMKYGSTPTNTLTINDTIYGSNGIVASEIIWADEAPYEIISDGSVWRSIGPANGTVYLAPSLGFASITTVAAVSTANVVLETMSFAAGTNIDAILPKTGNLILLKNQSAPEENGVYILPAANITIAVASIANENIATIANGTVVNAHVCVTGEKIALRFQTTISQNGIYVVGATAGTTIRDTSLLNPAFLTPSTLKGVRFYADFWNYPAGATTALSPTSTGAHVNDRKIFAQTNNNLTTFTGAAYSSASAVYSIRVPVNATSIRIEGCGFGGAGGGGHNGLAVGAGGGGGALPFEFIRKVSATNGIITITMPWGSLPGQGDDGLSSNGTSVNILAVDTTYSTFNITVPGGTSGLSNSIGGGAVATSTGGPLYTAGGNNGVAGATSFWGAGGAPGAGGVLGGGGGGAGLFAGGAGGPTNAVASGLGTPGNNGAGFGAGGGGGGRGPASGRSGRGGFGGFGYIKLTWS